MQKVTVVGRRFERVADRVAVVQDDPQAGLALVRADDLALQLDRAPDHVAEQDRLLEAQQRLGVRLQRPEQVGVADHRHLDDLRPAGRVLALRQRLQHAGVRHHQRRLVERPDQVLAEPVIDAGLAADARIDLGQQRRRHLDDRDAAQERRRDEPGHVADHAAADRHHEVAPVRADLDQPVVHRLDAAQVLALLAAVRRQDLDVPPELSQRRLDRRAEPLPDVAVGDHARPALQAGSRHGRPDLGGSARADERLVGRRAGLDLDGPRVRDDRLRERARTSSAMTSTTSRGVR